LDKVSSGVRATSASWANGPRTQSFSSICSSRLIESGWSLKALHREIMLSATYALSTKNSEKTEHR
jgi:hypothetical protein